MDLTSVLMTPSYRYGCGIANTAIAIEVQNGLLKMMCLGKFYPSLEISLAMNFTRSKYCFGCLVFLCVSAVDSGHSAPGWAFERNCQWPS